MSQNSEENVKNVKCHFCISNIITAQFGSLSIQAKFGPLFPYSVKLKQQQQVCLFGFPE